MNDQQATEIVRECMTDERALTINMTIKDAWLLISAIQLATRHPELSGYMKDSLFSSARLFQVEVEAVHPKAHDLIEMGWNIEYDGVDSLDEYDGVVTDIDDRGPFSYLQADDDDDGFDEDDFDSYDDY